MKSLSPVDFVIGKLDGVGYKVTPEARHDGVLLSGVPEWTIFYTPEADDPERLLGQLAGPFACVLAAPVGKRMDVRALLWIDELLRAIQRVRDGAVENARLASGANDLLAKLDGRGQFRVDARRGCSLVLTDWTFLLLGWRLALRYERRGALPESKPEGTRIGRYIAYDYDAVRAGLICEELDHEVEVHSRPLISSPMGLLALPVSALSSSVDGFVETTPVQLGEALPVAGSTRGGRDGSGGRQKARGRGRGCGVGRGGRGRGSRRRG